MGRKIFLNLRKYDYKHVCRYNGNYSAGCICVIIFGIYKITGKRAYLLIISLSGIISDVIRILIISEGRGKHYTFPYPS